MCDTIVADGSVTPNGNVLFGKNSDREPGETQWLELIARQQYALPRMLRCTYEGVPQVAHTNALLLSRPCWMWGGEMGINEHGVVIGNEAVFTKVPVAKSGLTGMDLLRLALERAASAREALDVITALLNQFEQGGACGYRQKNFYYHNSFVLADAQEAWVLETAGKYWAAQRVRGVRTISNALSIGPDFDLLGPGTYEFARSQGWCQDAQRFSFVAAFEQPLYRTASGGRVRATCTHDHLQASAGKLTVEDFASVLTAHNGKHPQAGWRMEMPCAHASWWPTRQAGQTTASLLAELQPNEPPRVWATGTSSPCLSVFKPVPWPIHSSNNSSGSWLNDQAGAMQEAQRLNQSLFWLHEKFQRQVLADYEQRAAIGQAERVRQQLLYWQAEGAVTTEQCTDAWRWHQERLVAWINESGWHTMPTRWDVFTSNFWKRQNLLDEDQLMIS